MEVSELTKETIDEQIPIAYEDLCGAFSKEASNELPNHGVSDMKIAFKEWHEPRNIGLRPMSPMDLEELQEYFEENLGKG